MVKTFLAAGIDVNISQPIGSELPLSMPTLHLYYDTISCLQILLDNGVDPDIKDREFGRLPWCMPLYKMDLVSTDLFIMNHSRTTKLPRYCCLTKCSITGKGRKPWKFCEVSRILGWPGNPENKAVFTAVFKGRSQFLSGLLRVGANLEAKDEEGRSGLCLLNIWRRNVKIFIQAWADVESRDESGLDIAV